MKTIAGVLSLTVALFLFSCGSTSPSIVGEWQLADLDLGVEILEGEDETFDSMLQTMVENTFYIFNDDGTMRAESWAGQPVVEEGTYKLKGKKLMVTLNDKKDEVEYTLSDSTLVLMVRDQDIDMVMKFVRK